MGLPQRRPDAAPRVPIARHMPDGSVLPTISADSGDLGDRLAPLSSITKTLSELRIGAGDRIRRFPSIAALRKHAP